MHGLKEVVESHKEFTKERNWDQFLNPKNLSMALSKETSELIEIFTWMTTTQSENIDEKTFTHVKEEIADVFLYLSRLADLMNIDIIEAAKEKMKKNIIKYPIEKSLELAELCKSGFTLNKGENK